MGAPELPNCTGDEDLHIAAPIQHAPIASDDSDDHEIEMESYNGYQPLATDEATVSEATNPNSMSYEHEEETYENAEVIHGDPNLPPVESIDSEVERLVWSNPRPQELQIELDSEKTSQILNAMASFTLPNMTIPEWAVGVPEEDWKTDLLQRIRDRKQTQTSNKVEKGDDGHNNSK